MADFQVVSDFNMTGDQPEAVAGIVAGFNAGERFQTLLGVTGSGKTFTMANVIKELNRPTIVLAHNKTLAAQLYSEFKEFFPHNAVEYFVSYYDYYQPEAYIPSSDTYIEKDASINDEIDKLRLSATCSLFERRDVIIIASVSCIYGLGDPTDYNSMVVSLRPGMMSDRDGILRKLVELQYVRNDLAFERGTFRVRGDVIEIFPAYYSDKAYRVEMFGDEIERVTEVDPLTGEILGTLSHATVFPASHFVTTKEKIIKACESIETELEARLKQLHDEGKLIEEQRLRERVNYDVEMLREMGFCSGVENYSRHLSGREAGSTPYTLLDYFPDNYLIIADESHVTLPQFRGMYEGDKARKTTLIDFGFRLPSAADNRPLKFFEFEGKINQILFVSATPGPYENAHANGTFEQIIRPTGLIDPYVDVRPTDGQIDDLIADVRRVTDKKGKVLVTTLTKKMAERLTEYLSGAGIRVRYLHSDIVTLERLEIIRDLRLDLFDVLVGINLLREGLDIPEVSLVAILDADKEGFLRSETSLIQTIGRAARNVDGRVVMYADGITGSMERAIRETNRRRDIQIAYNDKHGITPRSIIKPVRDIIQITAKDDEKKSKGLKKDPESMSREELLAEIKRVDKLMKNAAAELNFERAALLRDEMIGLRKYLNN